MNRKIALALAAFAVAASAGSAFAESPTVVNDHFVSTKSRAEVQAELFAYKKAGVNPWSTQYNPIAQFRSTLSRDQVTAGYIAARDEVAATNSEDSGSRYFATAVRDNGTRVVAGQPTGAQ